MNCVGDYRLSTSLTSNRWALPPFLTTVLGTAYSELDYIPAIKAWNVHGSPSAVAITAAGVGTGNAFMAGVGSAAFTMSIDLQTSNGVEIAGLNAEEQSDISLLLQWSQPQAATHNIEVYTYYDAMIILRENNIMELVQ